MDESEFTENIEGRQSVGEILDQEPSEKSVSEGHETESDILSIHHEAEILDDIENEQNEETPEQDSDIELIEGDAKKI